MSKLALTDATMLDPEARAPSAKTLLLDGGRIAGRLPADAAPGPDWERRSCAGLAIAPGFLDLHFHGALFTAGPERFPAVLADAAQTMPAHGTTAFLATTLAWSRTELAPRVSALASAISEPDPSRSRGAACLGLHLEGPWLSALAPGAMTTECIRPFDSARDEDVLERAGSLLRMVTLAPEIAGAARLIEALNARNAVAALGHSRATAAEIDEGVARGIRHATHLFNAMGPMHHREPGVAGAVLANDGISADLICDGHHVHPAMVRVAARTLRERLMLITDRVELGGDDGALRADADPHAPVRLADGTIAGSQLQLDRAVLNAQRFAGLEICEAIAACTLRPARLLGIENQRGTLRAGARADLAVLDGEGRVHETWIAGRCVWRPTATR